MAILTVHDMWTFGANLEKGDVDDIMNCFYLARECKQLTIYVTNDTGDQRRYHAFVQQYGDMLRAMCPAIQLVTGEFTLSEVDKIILCAPLHPDDACLLREVRRYRPHCKYYAQGDTPNAYNMNGSALTPYVNFETSTLQTENGPVPITLYHTASTNRKFTLDQLRTIAPEFAIHDMLIYGKHKLCFLPSLPFAVGLLMKKYGTGNTSYGLCHTMNLMELDDPRDPDVVISAYLAKYGKGHVDRTIRAYPAVEAYIQTMKEKSGKLDDVEDMAIFKRAMTLIVECTILWFGKKALDRFRTLADSDVMACVTDEKYSTSMFDLVVGVAALHDLSPEELAIHLPGTANQLARGSFLDLFNRT